MESVIIIKEKIKNEIISEISDIDYHRQAMGCGLEDVGITDRYEAMEYGFREALRVVFEIIKNIE